VGGTERYWRIVPREYLDWHNVNITIAIRPGTELPANRHRLTFVGADGCGTRR
jgi:hypothetical protein